MLNTDALFFILGWEWCSFHKKRIGASYVKLVFLHLVGYEGHIVHSGTSWARNVDALFFMLVWDCHWFHKKRINTCYAELMFCIRYDLWVM
jgi:hypothetical protein